MAKLDVSVPVLTLNDGHKIPQLAFGVGTALAFPGDKDEKKSLVENVKLAISLGYRHLDGAEAYDNEEELGQAIKASKVKREEFFITTKAEKSKGDIPAALDASLKKLGLDYVDLYLIHSPWFVDDDETEQKRKLQEAWQQMETVQASGKARSIGVSNYVQKHLEQTLEVAKVVPAVNQIEFHPYLQHGSLLDFHRSKGIITAAYAPNTPVLAGKGGPLDSVLPGLAKKYYVNESEICLRYVMEKGGVPITTSSKEQRLSDYMRAIAIKMTPREVKEMDTLGEQKHHRGFFNKRYADDDRT